MVQERSLSHDCFLSEYTKDKAFKVLSQTHKLKS